MLSNLRLYAVLALINLVCIGAVSGYVGVKAYNWGANAVTAKWNAAKLQHVNDKINTKAKQDEIQNAPIDNRVTNRRLSNRTF